MKKLNYPHKHSYDYLHKYVGLHDCMYDWYVNQKDEVLQMFKTHIDRMDYMDAEELIIDLGFGEKVPKENMFKMMQDIKSNPIDYAMYVSEKLLKHLLNPGEQRSEYAKKVFLKIFGGERVEVRKAAIILLNIRKDPYKVAKRWKGFLKLEKKHEKDI